MRNSKSALLVKLFSIVGMLALLSLSACSGDGAFDGRGPDEENSSNSSGGDNPQDDVDEEYREKFVCPVVKSKSEFLNPDIDYGEMVDSRDGKVYKTVQIGTQVWMAENLNYDNGLTKCAADDEKNCEIYGRLYFNTDEVCPEGWHVPSSSEWVELRAMTRRRGVAAPLFKSKYCWPAGSRGIDVFGFSVAPGGPFCDNVSFLSSMTSHGVDCAKFMVSGRVNDNFYDSDEILIESCDAVSVPVRCVQDTVEGAELVAPAGQWTDSSYTWHWKDVSKKDLMNSSVSYGEMTDERDGQIYKTVTIGDQTWMAENLNYAYIVAGEEEEGRCFKTFPSNSEGMNTLCDVFGRAYPMSAAMDSAAVFSDDGMNCSPNSVCSPNKQVRGICPDGWRLPADDDWKTLFKSVGGAKIAGKKLKSRSSWYVDGNGSDDYGFSVLPAGYGGYNGFVSDAELSTAFWSVVNKHFYPGWFFTFYNDAVYRGSSVYMYIRCIKGYTHEVADSNRFIYGIDPATVVKGTLIDSRDGNTYKTVKIGNQTWMAENLRLEYKVSDTLSVMGSICHSDSTKALCDTYGGYYSWPVALDHEGRYSSTGKDCGTHGECKLEGHVRGICPEGWHLPSEVDFDELYQAVGGDSVARQMLKSSSGWVERANGWDFYGFNAMPAGTGRWSSSFGEWTFKGISRVGNFTSFWTSNGFNLGEALSIDLGTYSGMGFVGITTRTSKESSMSVRCVMDD